MYNMYMSVDVDAGPEVDAGLELWPDESDDLQPTSSTQHAANDPDAPLLKLDVFPFDIPFIVSPV